MLNILCLYFLLNSFKSKEIKTVEILSSDSKYLSPDYTSLFQIPITTIKYLFSNGGERSNYELSKAFDNNWDTHWRSEGQQGEPYTNKKTNITYDSLINFIIITFEKVVYLDKMVYKTDNCVTCEGIGYPTVLKVYSKLNNNHSTINPYSDSGFELIDEISSEAVDNKVIFYFSQTIKCDQIKLEWVEIKTYQRFEKFTTAKEIQFFIPENEYLNETILNIFSSDDYRFMTLNETFNSVELIETIIQNNEHILNFHNPLNNYLARAKLASTGALKFDSRREFTTNQSSKINIIRQRGNVLNYVRNTLKMSMAGTNRQSIGIFALANEQITIYAYGEENDPLPKIIFSQYIGTYNNWLSNEINLIKGRQNLICKHFNVDSYSIKVISGGPIYITNPYTSSEQSQNVKIYIEGGKIFPSFRLGENDESEYKYFLEDYIKMYNSDKEKYYDMTELFGFRSMMTVPATLAYNIYKDPNKGPTENLNYWDEYIKKLFSFDGVQYDPLEPYYDIKSTYSNLHIRYAQPIGAAYASTEHIGIFDEGWFNGAIYGKILGWGFAHEIGHTMDINERTVSETSNNMISKFDETFIRKEGTRGEFERSLLYLTPDNIDVLERGCDIDSNKECKGFFRNLQLNYLIWWYIESYSPGYWGKLDNMYRYNYSLTTGMTATEREIFFTNIIIGVDLGYYFNRWGFYLNNDGIFIPENAGEIYKSKMKEYINNGKIKENIILKLWYLDYKEYIYNIQGDEGCYENKDIYNIEIKKVYYISNNKTIILLPEINCKGHLGFEIYEKDKLLGFTYDNIFIDNNKYESNYIQEYKIIGYDRKLETSKESEIKRIETNSEVCSYNGIKYNSIKEAIKTSTEDEIKIYLLKDINEGTIEINKKVNIYISEEISNKNITIYKIDSGNLFNIKENGYLNIEGKNENSKIILDGMNIKTNGNLIYCYKGTLTGNYLILQNLNNSEENGGAIYTESCLFILNNSLLYNNYASQGAGLYSKLISGKSMISKLYNVIFNKNKGINGAGIKNTGEITLNNCEINNCYASNNGAGIANDVGGIAYLNDVIINGNIAENMGGGLYIDGFTNLNRVIISENKANIGAGIAYIGGNDRRVLNVEKDTIISNNIAFNYGGSIYIKNGIINLNGGEIYDNNINNDKKTDKINSDLFFIENGKININSIRLSGSIYKSNSGIIYLKSKILKYSENSKIYIDFPNNGTIKNLIIPSSYSISSEDLNSISLVDPDSGKLELSSDNNIIFSPKILQISFKNSDSLNMISYLEETKVNNESYYYGKSLILTQDLFPIKNNEYVSKIFDQNGNNYNINQTIILKTDMEFDYIVSYKNKIIFDFIDDIVENLIIPNEYLYLPSFREDLSSEKEILYWKDYNTQETFNIGGKILGNDNKTFVAVYSNYGNNFMVKIFAFGINYYSNLVEYKYRITFPIIDIPKDNHLIGWKDLCSNKEYDINITDSPITKDYYLVAIIIGYVKYYISDKLIIQKSYNINSTFIILNNDNFQGNKIKYWKNKLNNDEYYSDKSYELKGDIDLIAILEDQKEEDGKNTGLIIGLSISGIFFILIIVFFIYRYIRLKRANESRLDNINITN